MNLMLLLIFVVSLVCLYKLHRAVSLLRSIDERLWMTDKEWSDYQISVEDPELYDGIIEARMTRK